MAESLKQWLWAWMKRSMLEIVLFVICVILACKAKAFFSTDNLLNILSDLSMRGVIALGMTMVIIAGEIDLSVGSMAAFACCLAAWLTEALAGPRVGAPVAVAVALAAAACFASCFGVGCLSGYLRMRFQVPTFIATLAWMTVLRGSAGLITKGNPLTPFPEWYNFIGSGYVLGVPVPAIIFLLVFVAVHILMNHTSFGRAVYAVGGNTEAARLSGIKVWQVKILVMGIVSGLAALGGIMLSSRIMSGRAETAEGWELDVISAVIIGGTSLMGGAGKVWGTLVGLVFLQVLVNGMTHLNIMEYWQQVVRGALILAAVLINLAPGSRK
jgi:sugar transport system permease protein